MPPGRVDITAVVPARRGERARRADQHPAPQRNINNRTHTRRSTPFLTHSYGRKATYLHTQVAGHLLTCQAIHDAAQSFPLPQGEERQPPQWVVAITPGRRASRHRRLSRCRSVAFLVAFPSACARTRGSITPQPRLRTRSPATAHGQGTCGSSILPRPKYPHIGDDPHHWPGRVYRGR